MRIKLASIASALVLSAAIGLSGAAPAQAACRQGSPGFKEVLGTIGGAVLGGLIGSQIGRGRGRGIAIGAGVVIGGLVGNRIGNSMDCEDVRRHNQAMYTSLERQPDGTSSGWDNPNTGARGNTTPTQTYYRDNTPCRRFNTTVTTGTGETETGSGTACRNERGGWDIE